MSAAPTFKDGARVRYKTRTQEGTGRVVETYLRGNGKWVIVHDKKNNRSVSCRPGQLSKP